MKLLNIKSIYASFEKQVSPSSLGLLRIFIGLMMFWQISSLEPYIVGTLTNSKFFLTYDLFHWVKILPKESMSHLFLFSKILCLLVAAGVLYRICISLLFISWTYIFLLDAGHYNNHYYLYCILLFLMIFVDADSRFSIRGLWHKKSVKSIPFWQVFIFRFQLFIVYFYGGIAKLEHDWLHGYPMRIWMHISRENPQEPSLLNSDFAIYFLSWSGLLFDLLIGFLLLYRKTRYWALIPIAVFHVSNHFLWEIGTFPWFMLGATMIFFNPTFPDKILAKFRSVTSSNQISLNNRIEEVSKYHKGITAVLIIHFLIQLIFPFRQHLYEGNTSWHGQGHFFAWRMMLTDRADAIKVKLGIPGKGIVGQVELQEYINFRQFFKMPRRPKSYNRLAKFIRDEVQKNTEINNAEVYVVLWRQLNGRPYQLLIDSTVNLAAYPYSNFKPAQFILPFENTNPKLDINTLDEFERDAMKLNY